MKLVMSRITFVAVALILLFEFVCQLEVRRNWRESTGELAQLAVLGFLLCGVIWAVLPAFSNRNHRTTRIVARSSVAAAFVIALHVVIFMYSWHIRPNVGLYDEPGWISRHPQFQAEQRARIERNRWW